MSYIWVNFVCLGRKFLPPEWVTIHNFGSTEKFFFRWWLFALQAIFGEVIIVYAKLQNGKSTVKTQPYLLAMSGWIT